MTSKKIYKVEMTLSQYNANDEGFYSIKNDFEIATDYAQLLESFDIVKNNILDYINRRIK